MNIRLLGLILVLLSLESYAGIEHAVGVARDAENGALRYIEHHQYFDDGTHQVDYYTPDMNRIAYKTLAYEGLPQHPNIVSEDFNRGSKTQVSIVDGQVVMTSERANDVREGSLAADPELVVDAGFDAYIRENLDTLLQQGETRLKFAVAGFPRTLTMRVEAEPSARDGEYNLSIYPNNLFVRLFVPRIDLTYSDTPRLKEYRGYSNLIPDDGRSPLVVIAFDHYETEERLDGPMASWLPVPTGPAVTGQ